MVIIQLQNKQTRHANMAKGSSKGPGPDGKGSSASASGQNTVQTGCSFQAHLFVSSSESR